MEWVKWVWLLPLLFVFRFIFKNKSNKNQFHIPQKYLRRPFPVVWKKILEEKVLFYFQLPKEDQKIFEKRILEFIYDVKIIGIKTEVTEEIKILTAASAVIPTFKIPGFRYTFVDEVAILPTVISNGIIDAFGQFKTHPFGNIVVLYREALLEGFEINNDKENVGIHEFIHAFDQADGDLDGIPSLTLSKDLKIKWIEAMYKTIQEIKENHSSIDTYGTTNQQEFFAVVSTYYFEQPQLLERENPDLYNLLNQIFIQNPANYQRFKRPREIQRNEPCPCGSGKKFKKCCMKKP